MNLPARTMLAALALGALLGACGRSGSPEATFGVESTAREAGAHWFAKRWKEAFAVCDRIFRRADKENDARAAVWSGECVAEGAARMGQPELALPHLERLFSAYDANLAGLGSVRLANNYGVTLIESDRREAGLAMLRDALGALDAIDALPDAPKSVGRRTSGTTRAVIVMNLARAYYESASEPAVRAWVEEQAAWYMDFMEKKQNVSGAIGSAAALDAISTLGKRQANVNTPAWDAMAREWEGLEESATRHDAMMGRPCEMLPLGEIQMELCMRELKPR